MSDDHNITKNIKKNNRLEDKLFSDNVKDKYPIKKYDNILYLMDINIIIILNYYVQKKIQIEMKYIKL